MCFQVLKLWPYLALWTANVRSSAAVVITHWAQSHHLTQPHQPAIPLKINHSKVRISPQKARFPNFQLQCRQFSVLPLFLQCLRRSTSFDVWPAVVVFSNSCCLQQLAQAHSSELWEIFFNSANIFCLLGSFLFCVLIRLFMDHNSNKQVEAVIVLHFNFYWSVVVMETICLPRGPLYDGCWFGLNGGGSTLETFP